MKINLRITHILMMLVLTTFLSASSYKVNAGNGRHTADSIIIKRSQTNSRYKVKLYPNATSEVLFFSASGEEGKIYQLFIFNLDGKLVKQTQIHNRETTLVAKMEKGDYLFEVFSDDERIENGTLQFK
jgi:hypothetical protein